MFVAIRYTKPLPFPFQAIDELWLDPAQNRWVIFYIFFLFFLVSRDGDDDAFIANPTALS